MRLRQIKSYNKTFLILLKLGEIVAQMGTTTSPGFNKIGSKTKTFYYRTVFV